MERSVVFLLSMLVLLLAKHVISSASNCTCQFPSDYCVPNITAVQGKVIGSKLVDEKKQVVSDESLAYKTRFTVQLTQILINGSYPLLVTNNTFNLRVPLNSPCHGKLEVNMSYIAIGNVNSVGRYNNLTCCLKLPTKSRGRNSRSFSGETTNFQTMCNQS